jgi:fluoroquinolone resistance protein
VIRRQLQWAVAEITSTNISGMDAKLHENKTFEKINYAGKDLKNREFEQCTFKQCDFSGSNLAQNRFSDCTFLNCNLALAKLTNTGLRNTAFTECKLIGINFSDCEDFLFSVKFNQCMLDFASFMGKKLPKTPFIHSSLKDVNFSGCNLSGASFEKTDLSGALFNKTILRQADFSSAFNFSIDPELNDIKKATFSRDGLMGLLDRHDIQLS